MTDPTGASGPTPDPAPEQAASDDFSDAPASAADIAALSEGFPEVDGLGRGFVHLHVHTEHSPKDSVSRVADIAKRSAALGMPAVAMTDHGDVGGAWKFSKACKVAGVKPVMGVEGYLALVPDGSVRSNGEGRYKDLTADPFNPQVRFEKFTRQGMDAETGKAKRQTNNHITILARNTNGWRNLMWLVNEAETSFYNKPLMDWHLLKTAGHQRWTSDGRIVHAALDPQTNRLVGEDGVIAGPEATTTDSGALREPGAGGLIMLSGCLGGPVASHVAAARTDVFDDQGTLVRSEWDESELGKARANLGYLIDCVGRENVYVEIMHHGLSAEGPRHIGKLIELADEAGVRYVATNDSHFTHGCDCRSSHGCDEHGATEHHGCDAEVHDAWLASGQSQTGKPPVLLSEKDPEKRWRFNGAGYHLRSAEEMRGLFRTGKWAQACDETLRIAARIDDDVIPFKALRLPRFPVPVDAVAAWEQTGATPAERKHKTASAFYLYRLVLDGAKERWSTPQAPGLTPEQRDRLRFEFDVITGMGLEDYFLIVWDALRWARSTEAVDFDPAHPDATEPKKPILVGHGRGSAAGSAVSYALRIVMVDPLENDLLFERFLDVKRKGMPDIDVDFETDRRNEVYEYLGHKYGFDHVARIGAFQMSKSKSAIKDAARLLDQTALGNKMAGTIPVEFGSPLPFTDLDKPGNEKASDFQNLLRANPDAVRIADLARGFEKVVKGNSIHAAGIIISDEPLTGLVPMRVLRNEATDVRVCLWDGKDVDDFGMLKLDALSLRNLDVVAAAVENISLTTGEVIHPDTIAHPDTTGDPRVDKAYALLRRGRTSGVFQLESGGITELTESVAPTRFSDLSAILALYRPGPMAAGMHTLFGDRKNGRAEVDYAIFTPVAEEQAVIRAVLADTHGLITYQEQVMLLSLVVAGFDADQRNKLRKAFSKKDKEAMASLRAAFVENGQKTMLLEDGTQKIAFRAATVEELWRTFEGAAAYLFNKSHSVAYGSLTFMTSYLKANYPGQYGAALLSRTSDAARRLSLLNTLDEEGLRVAAPDVNASDVRTLPSSEDHSIINIGLGEIGGLKTVAGHVLAARNGPWGSRPFESLADLVDRVQIPGTDPRTKKATIKRLPTSAVESLIESGALDSLGSRLAHTMTMRVPHMAEHLPDIEWGPLEKAARQRARLHFATGEHPVNVFREQVASGRAPTISHGSRPPESLEEALAGDIDGSKPVNIFALLTGWEEKQGGRGRFARFTVESETMNIDGVAWSSTLNDLIAAEGSVPPVGSLVQIVGRAQVREIVVEKDDTEAGIDGADPADGIDTEPEVLRRTEIVANRIHSIRVADVATVKPVVPAPAVSPVGALIGFSAARHRETVEAKEQRLAAAAAATAATQAALKGGAKPPRKKAATTPRLNDGQEGLFAAPHPTPTETGASTAGSTSIGERPVEAPEQPASTPAGARATASAGSSASSSVRVTDVGGSKRPRLNPGQYDGVVTQFELVRDCLDLDGAAATAHEGSLRALIVTSTSTNSYWRYSVHGTEDGLPLPGDCKDAEALASALHISGTRHDLAPSVDGLMFRIQGSCQGSKYCPCFLRRAASRDRALARASRTGTGSAGEPREVEADLPSSGCACDDTPCDCAEYNASTLYVWAGARRVDFPEFVRGALFDEAAPWRPATATDGRLPSRLLARSEALDVIAYAEQHPEMLRARTGDKRGAAA